MDENVREIVRAELNKLVPQTGKFTGKSKKKMETSKAFLWAVFGLAVFCVVACFIFAAVENVDLPEHVYGVVNVVLGILSVIASGYFTKSWGEKHSRNKAGVDADGKPIADSP